MMTDCTNKDLPALVERSRMASKRAAQENEGVMTRPVIHNATTCSLLRAIDSSLRSSRLVPSLGLAIP